MALNLWEQAGSPTSHLILPYGLTPGLTGVPITTGDYTIRFKAKGAGGRILVIDSGGVGIQTYLIPGADWAQYEYTFSRPTLSGSNNIYIHDPDNSKNVSVMDIQFIEKGLGRATVNGVDGFRSGKWGLGSSLYWEVIDDERLRLKPHPATTTSDFFIDVEPNTTYSFYIENEGPDIGGVVIRDSSGSPTLVSAQAMTAPATFTTPSNTRRIYIRLHNYAVNNSVIFARPILNIGQPAPYQKKIGTRMVDPSKKKADTVPRGKNLSKTSTSGWEQGAMGVTAGQPYSGNTSSNRIKSNNFFEVKGNTSYYKTVGPGFWIAAVWFDANDIVLGWTGYHGNEGHIATTPSNAVKARLAVRMIDDANLGTAAISQAKPMYAESLVPVPYEPYRPGSKRAEPKKNMIKPDNWVKGRIFDSSFMPTGIRVEGNNLVIIGGTTMAGQLVSVEPYTDYTVHHKDSTSHGIYVYTKTGSELSAADRNTPVTFNSGSSTEIIIGLYKSSGLSALAEAVFTEPQMEKGTEQTEFKPYQGGSKRAEKGLKFGNVTNQSVNCGVVDLSNANFEVEMKIKLNSTPSGTHALFVTSTYATGILLNQIGAYLYVYIGSGTNCLAINNFFEIDKELELKFVFDKVNNDVRIYKNGVQQTFSLISANVNYAGIVAQSLYIAGAASPSSFPSIDGVIHYAKIRKDGETILEHNYDNPAAIVGTKVKALKGPNGSLIGNPTQLNPQAR